MDLDGACHCGRIRLALAGAPAREAIVPRACVCSYCRRLGALWWSDPAARLRLAGPAPARYRFASGSADFLFCPDCGTVLAAVSRIDGAEVAVANLRMFPSLGAAQLPARPTSFDGETLADRLARRRRLWMPLSWISP